MRSARGPWLTVLILGAAASVYADAPAAAAAASAPAPAPGRVVIRGSGSDVRLERVTTPSAVRKRFDAGPPVLLQDVARMTKEGVGDPVVIAYLKEHARALPKILGQEDIAWLQARGVREPVLAFLTRTLAVDIGPTGEGREAPAVYPGSIAGLETPEMAVEYPGEGFVSYGGGYFPAPRRFLTHHVVSRRHGFISPRPMAVPPPLRTPPPAVSNTILGPRPAGSWRDRD